MFRYHVRLDAASTRHTRLLFCTTGILLRRLASDAQLSAVSHVIVDEVRILPHWISCLTVTTRCMKHAKVKGELRRETLACSKRSGVFCAESIGRLHCEEILQAYCVPPPYVPVVCLLLS